MTIVVKYAGTAFWIICEWIDNFIAPYFIFLEKSYGYLIEVISFLPRTWFCGFSDVRMIYTLYMTYVKADICAPCFWVCCFIFIFLVFQEVFLFFLFLFLTIKWLICLWMVFGNLKLIGICVVKQFVLAYLQFNV